jgi:hypothetical protein
MYLDELEADLTEYLDTFTVPADFQHQLVHLHEQAEAGQASEAQRRTKVKTRLERIKELYAWGDMDCDDYQRERDQLTAEPATLQGAEDQSAVLERTAAFLADLPAAWRAADQEQSNRLLRLLLVELELNDKRVAAVVPHPEFAPFFALDWQAKYGRCGSDGLPSRAHVCPKRSGPRYRHGTRPAKGCGRWRAPTA